MTFLESLLARIRGVRIPAPVTVPPAHRTIHEVTASSFADLADVRAFERCKDGGGTDNFCFSKGDNGVGCWGDKTAQESVPMCALPPEDMVERWGSVRAAKHRKVTVRANSQEVVCVLADRMPARANIRNGAGIDLNPGALKVLGLRPPVMVEAEWEWA